MIRKVLLGVILLITSQTVLASKPYLEYKYQYEQPNGDVVTIIANGDDYFAEQHSLTGELVVYDEAVGGMVYATVNEERTQLISTGELVSPSDYTPFNNRYTRRRGLSSDSKQEESGDNKENKLGDEQKAQQVQLLTREQLLQQRGTYASGDVKGLTIIIQFPDEAGTLNRSQINNFLNGTDYNGFGNDSSIREYFQNVSNGQLNYTNTVSHYYTAQHNKAYYTDDDFSSTVRSQEIISEALNWLENTQNFDFSTLSTDADNRIMGLNIFYAGETDSAWSRGLWPHMGKLQPSFCADGVCTDRYQIANMGTSLTIGPFAHETGHLLARWPDLFDYDASSNGSVASFGLMGTGAAGPETSLKPVPPNGYFRYLAGWDTVTELNPAIKSNAPQGELTHTSGSHSLYRWSNPHRQGEAFYIENIAQTGQNEYQADNGLAIWHIDPDGNNSDESLPFIQMEHADGNRDPENKVNQGDDSDLFDSGSFDFNAPNSESSASTNSRWSNGNDSGLSITNIGSASSTIHFTVGDQQQPPTGQDYLGYLYHHEIEIQPNGSWFYYKGGDIALELTGPNNTDFDIRLERWNGYNWSLIAISQSPNSEESIQYSANAGYYRVRVYSYYGSGYYMLNINK